MNIDALYGIGLWKGQVPPHVKGERDRLTRQCLGCGKYVPATPEILIAHQTHRRHKRDMRK